ncbi:MAG: hypothetical protein ACRYHQ_28345 [Janthinobacterium lividum]
MPTPPSDFVDHRGTISYQLGALDATVGRLIQDVRENKASVDHNFAEQKETLERIEGKIKTAEADVKVAFHTTKVFFGGVIALIVFVIDHLDFIKKHTIG